MEEAVKKVPDEYLELNLFTLCSDGLGLGTQREYRMFGRTEETKSLRHGGPP